jgi:NCS1 family nucleobase:cation symporter-1
MTTSLGERPARGLAAIGAEYRALDKIPAHARTFTFWDQAALWFAAASLPAAWYYGALMAGWKGIPGALFLIFVVNTLILIPWAYLGYIAAESGAASMAFVRPTFGLRGSAVPSVFYLIFGLGWGAVNVFLGAIALSFIFKAVFGWPAFMEPGFRPYMAGAILAVCVLQGMFAVAGHRLIRIMEWGATLALIVLGGYQTYLAVAHWGVQPLMAWRPPAGGLTATFGAPPLAMTYQITLALLIDLLIAYNWTWEFIGDFSRFARTKRAGTWGPFAGASVAQYWWFMVGALGVAFLTLTTGQYAPQASDPSSISARLGYGWIAAIVILAATVATNAGNIYASALGVSNMAPGWRVSIRRLLAIIAVAIVPLSLVPLTSGEFVGFYIFFLDFLGGIVVPLWTIVLADRFLGHRAPYHDDLFREQGGRYWFRNGWRWPAIVTLLLGTAVYWVLAFVLPGLRERFTAAGPTAAVVLALYILWVRGVPGRPHGARP